MLNQFTDEYKQVMLAAENRAKQFGYKEIIPEDVFMQIAAITQGNMYDLFATFGINDALVADVMSRSPFVHDVPRTGDYI